MNTETDDFSLAQRARSGDRDALERLVTKLRLPLFALAYSQLRHYEDAQDAVSDAILRICTGIVHLKQPERVRAWMYRIARNEARRVGRRTSPVRDIGGYDPPSESTEEDTALKLDIESALRRLPQEQSRAVALFYLSGVPIREIAHRLSRPEGTIKFWLHEGRYRLADEMEGYRPMDRESERPTKAAILSSDIEPDLLEQMTHALKRAGFQSVSTISDPLAAVERSAEETSDKREIQLPAPLKGCLCLVLDECIGGRSAFELLPLLNASVQRKEMPILLLTNAAPDRPELTELTVRAAYASGVDMLLTKPFDMDEFEQFARRLHVRSSESGGTIGV